jgi:hypothetical protein
MVDDPHIRLKSLNVTHIFLGRADYKNLIFLA